jgi:site-specific DNA recombinase
MIGTERREIVYYRCHRATNNQGCPDKYAGHPAAVYMREDLIMAEVSAFFTERVFGSQRREKFLASLTQIDDAAHCDRQAGLERANRAVAEISRKQADVLRQVDEADARDPFGQGLRQRYNELQAERESLLATVAELDLQLAAEPDRPSADQVDLLEALPYLAVNMNRAPEELLGRLFDLTQLTIRVHYATNEATLSITLPSDYLGDISEIGHLVQEASLTCDESAGQSQCATCMCPWSDSN